MRLDRRELAKLGMFLSVLMIIFGFGSFYAYADLIAGDPRFEQRLIARSATLWFFIGISGLFVLASSILQFRKSRKL